MKLSKPKYIFVTGGVASSLGKGIISASIARLLQARGYSVTIQKLDPYINVDPGTLNPYERGECYRIKNNIPSGTCYETCRSIHAEQNAIIQAGQDRCMGASMYIYGHNFICILCKRFIVQSGIVDVYLKKDDNSPIIHVSVDDIKRELDNPGVGVNEVVKS